VIAAADLGWLGLVENDCAGAATACEEGLALIRDTNDPKVSSELLLPLGLARLGMGEQRGGREIQEALSLARSLGLDTYVRECLDGLAAVAAADGEPSRCVLLLGAVEAMMERAGETRTKGQEVIYARHIRHARGSLSEEEWSTLQEQGRGKPLDEVIEYALESID
jgi:hypothetical protein